MERKWIVGLMIAVLIFPTTAYTAYQYGKNSILIDVQQTEKQVQKLKHELNQTLEQIKPLQEQIESFEQDQLLAQQRIQELEQELTEKQKRIEEIEQELKQLKDIKRVAIIVEESVLPEIKVSLNQYVKDIESLYNIEIAQYKGKWTDCLQLRAFIQSLYYNSTIGGAILIGNLPYALWEYSPAGTPDIGPLPFYYEDMDGTFEDKDADGIFDHYVWGKNEGPEIWIAWMRPDSNNTTKSLNYYLEKLHSYYSGNISYQNKALVCITKDWGGWTSELSLSLGKIYPEVTSIGGVSTEVTASQYLNEYVNWYEITDVWSGGDSNDQEFNKATNVFGKEIKSLSGGSKLTVIWGCHCGDFHKSPNENLAASYVFDSNFGLAAIAATRSIGIEKHEIVFQNLNEGDILGKAFFDWINLVYDKSFIQDRFQESEIDRFMWGFILIGDPFIQLDKYQNFLSN